MRLTRRIVLAIGALALALFAFTAGALAGTHHTASNTKTFRLAAHTETQYKVSYPHALKYAGAAYLCTVKKLQLARIPAGETKPKLRKVKIIAKGPVTGLGRLGLPGYGPEHQRPSDRAGTDPHHRHDEVDDLAVYLSIMRTSADARSFGGVFDEVAHDYDRHRPAYPDELIDRACEVAGLGSGARVLEIGCGTGQLTRSLLARGLQVTAVEPGGQLIARARARLDAAADVQFVNARLEDATLPHAEYVAVFSASAIHWIDPDVSWRKAADALVSGGTLALISYFGLQEPRSTDDQQALRAGMTRIAPELAAEWPNYRDLDGTLAGGELRRDNVSEVWAWLGSYEVARRYAAGLFEDVRLAAVPMLLEHTAEQLNALLGTMSFWARLSHRQRDALAAENDALHQRLGRPIRSSTVACLVTARRTHRT